MCRSRLRGGIVAALWSPHEYERLGWFESSWDDDKRPVYKPEGSLIGWADDEYLYLQQDLTYAAVSGFAQKGAIPFGIKPRALWNALARAESSLKDKKRSDTTARIQGKTKRVIQVPRSAVFEPNEND